MWTWEPQLLVTFLFWNHRPMKTVAIQLKFCWAYHSQSFTWIQLRVWPFSTCGMIKYTNILFIRTFGVWLFIQSAPEFVQPIFSSCVAAIPSGIMVAIVFSLVTMAIFILLNHTGAQLIASMYCIPFHNILSTSDNTVYSTCLSVLFLA